MKWTNDEIKKERKKRGFKEYCPDNKSDAMWIIAFELERLNDASKQKSEVKV